MIRFLFIPLFALILSSCIDSSKDDDPLFYRISEADSTKYMKEILDEIQLQALENRRTEDSLGRLGYWGCCDIREYLRVEIDSNNMVSMSLFEGMDINDAVITYFSINRNVTEEETITVAMNAKKEGHKCAFYTRYSMDDLRKEISQNSRQYNEIKQEKGADPALIEWAKSKMDEWEPYRMALKVTGAEYINRTGHFSRVNVEYPHTSRKSEEVLNSVAFAIYQLRNAECFRYFGESYLQLYDRHRRISHPADKKKLEAIKVICPNMIFDKNYQESPPIYTPEIELRDSP